MKILVMHDDKGEIKSIGVATGKLGGQMRLKAREGLHVSEVDAREVKDEKDHEQLRGIAGQFRIEGGVKRPQLVRK